MSDNLVFLINKLSYVIVSQNFWKDNAEQGNKDECYFNKCQKKVRQAGCDVLLKKIEGTPLKDPCVTDYGGNWSPVTLITDYGRELQAGGAGKCNDLLVDCLKILKEKQYDSVNEILKLLLLLKRPVDRGVSEYFQKLVSFTGSDSLLQSIDSRTFVLEDCLKEQPSNSSAHKKALQYEETWTKHFDAKFQLLGECSKKNLSSDKVSLNSLFPSRLLLNPSHSPSNSFVFPDFSTTKSNGSDKSLFDISSNSYSNDSNFLDNFVDQPITHKLPALSLHSKFSKTSFLEKSSVHLKDKAATSEERPTSGTSQHITSPQTSSIIELKRNSNCSHSFAILYETAAKSEATSSDSLSFVKGKGRNKNGSDAFTSKAVVLGLWEQEQSLLREFKPELATELPTLRIITLVEYVEDVKYLFTGINSGTFKYDSDAKCFRMVYGTCLEDVTPESLYDFSKEFLDIGNSYMMLSSRVADIGKNNFDTCTTISQAFWKSIFDILELHYSLVLDIPFSANLLALKGCTKDLYEISTTIATLCKVLTPEEPLPKGGELLTYLLEFAERINRQSIVNILFGILQNCCSVYFMYILQNWMFKGKLEDQGNEFFVNCRRQKIKTKSRAYYNAFYLIEEKVPSFLRGYEESVYNCGKSIHFLRLFNAEDKFCQVLEKADYPSMCVCFSEEQLSRLEGELKKYEERMVRLCGERITVKGMMEEEKEKERAYLEYVRECKKEEEERRERERMKALEEAKEAKEKQNQLLNEQRCLIEAEKERRREKEAAERLKEEEEMKRVETERQNLVNQEKNLLTSYYGQLMGALDTELRKQGKRQENLKNILTGKETEAELDLINDNRIQTESERRSTRRVDINSNAEPSEKFILSGKVDEDATRVGRTPRRNTSVLYDENSNPSESFGGETICDDPNANSLKPEEEVESRGNIHRTVSHRTVAAEEAERNKCKILRSEFGLPVRKVKFEQPQTEKNPRGAEAMSEAERNRQKVLDLEYNLMKSTRLPLTINPPEKVPKEGVEQGILKSSSEFLKPEDFATVGLERKPEQINLQNAPSVTSPVRNESPQSDSSDSFLTSNGMSAESVSNPCEETDSLQTRSSSMIFNEKYKEALTLDMNIFYHKLSHRHIFCNLKDGEPDSLPSTDFMVFQRYLRKSALIPLKIQERLANDALLKHLLKGENLLSHLNSLRGYFFLNDGEFGRSFTHHTFRSLAKCTEPNQFFERNNLSNIVNEALNYTIHNCEPNSQNLSFRIVKMPPFLNHSSHDVLSPFELSYKVDWPLTIILTEKALSKYKMVFRFLLKLKRINWTLNESFLYLNSHFKSKRLREANLKGSVHYHKIQIYRHAMTQVMITLDDYFFSDGIQFPWIYFLKDLETTENIDHLYQKHVRYIKDVLTRCFLSKNSEDLLECIHSMIELALMFHYTAKSSALVLVDGRYEHPKFPALKNTFNEFCNVIKTFLKTLKEKISSNQVLKSHYTLIEKFDLKLT